jgi:hypothetical protein
MFDHEDRSRSFINKPHDFQNFVTGYTSDARVVVGSRHYQPVALAIHCRPVVHSNADPADYRSDTERKCEVRR